MVNVLLRQWKVVVGYYEWNFFEINKSINKLFLVNKVKLLNVKRNTNDTEVSILKSVQINKITLFGPRALL